MVYFCRHLPEAVRLHGRLVQQRTLPLWPFGVGGWQGIGHETIVVIDPHFGSRFIKLENHPKNYNLLYLSCFFRRFLWDANWLTWFVAEVGLADDQQTTAHPGILAFDGEVLSSDLTVGHRGHSAQERPGTFIVKSLQPQVPVEGWKGVRIEKWKLGFQYLWMCFYSLGVSMWPCASEGKMSWSLDCPSPGMSSASASWPTWWWEEPDCCHPSWSMVGMFVVSWYWSRILRSPVQIYTSVEAMDEPMTTQVRFTTWEKNFQGFKMLTEGETEFPLPMAHPRAPKSWCSQ